MKTFKLARLGRLILIPSIFLSVSLQAQELQPSETIIDSVIWITVHTVCGDVRAQAKVDTGADGSSIDRAFAERFCIVDEPYVADTDNTKCPNGFVFVPPDECRPRVHFRFTAEEVRVDKRATLSDKTDDRYPILIGNRELEEGNFVIRPVREIRTNNWSMDDYEFEAEEEEEN